MKAVTKIIKLGKSMFAIQVQLAEGTDSVWGRFSDGALTAEQQFNVAKDLFTTNNDVQVEIEYEPIKDKKNVMISSIKAVVDGKVVEPIAEQTVAKKNPPKTKDIGTPEAKKQGSKPSYKTNNTQTSIEQQVASKDASLMTSKWILNREGDVDMIIKDAVKIYNALFDAAIAKISG